jgi:catechol 2,3-dioxygenase-like lactoylglutathione lyase family enzyme
MNSISHMMIFCRDQDEAKAFYTEKIGLECSADVPIGPGYRWLTFNHPDNPNFHLCVMPTGAGPYGPEIGQRQAELLALGGMMGGILETDDCRRDYEILKGRGVEFTEEPEERFYGVDCGFRDPSGVPWRLTQPAEVLGDVPSFT